VKRPRFAYLRLGETPAHHDNGVLYCDPLTSLVAYPSFEAHLVQMLPVFAGTGLHVAIGDVDGLREYVSVQRSSDPASFGHLAGNACMRIIGRVTTRWAESELADTVFQLCGTFGGDEVIAAASGISHELFADRIRGLCQAIKVAAPRPCSFALATLEADGVTPDGAADAYRCLVSMVDARLFQEKEQARRNGHGLDGFVTDLGIVDLHERAGRASGATGGRH